MVKQSKRCCIIIMMFIVDILRKLIYNINSIKQKLLRKENKMAKMTCPCCGEEFDEEFVEHLDNGNPACPACVADEQKREEQQ